MLHANGTGHGLEKEVDANVGRRTPSIKSALGRKVCGPGNCGLVVCESDPKGLPLGPPLVRGIGQNPTRIVDIP